jgi:hypothetical protein
MNELPHQSLLEELDARQDELLAELDRLNQRLEQVIRESTILRGPSADQPQPKAA